MMMRTTLPDLLLVDIQLPGMNGLDLTRHVRQDPRTRERVEAKAKTASAVDDRRKRRRVGRLRHHGLRARHRAPS